jgi:hypothetical protein
MKWLILVLLTKGEPFTIPIQEFESEDACYEYINSKENYPTIAIEVIAVAGFNDPVNDIKCLPENRVKEYLNVGSSMVST